MGQLRLRTWGFILCKVFKCLHDHQLKISSPKATPNDIRKYGLIISRGKGSKNLMMEFQFFVTLKVLKKYFIAYFPFLANYVQTFNQPLPFTK
jgi:hypothetical protein